MGRQRCPTPVRNKTTARKGDSRNAKPTYCLPRRTGAAPRLDDRHLCRGGRRGGCSAAPDRQSARRTPAGNAGRPDLHPAGRAAAPGRGRGGLHSAQGCGRRPGYHKRRGHLGDRVPRGTGRGHRRRCGRRPRDPAWACHAGGRGGNQPRPARADHGGAWARRARMRLHGRLFGYHLGGKRRGTGQTDL